MQPSLPLITAGAVLLAGCQAPVSPAPEDSPDLDDGRTIHDVAVRLEMHHRR